MQPAAPPRPAPWRRVLAVAAVVLVLASACGDDTDDDAASQPTAVPTATAEPDASPTAAPTAEPTATPDPTVAPEPTATPEPVTYPDSVAVDLVGCEQFSTNTGVDLEAAQAHVPAGEDLFLDISGSARVSLITKQCTDLVVDGVSAGPGHFNTLWVRVTGPEEARQWLDVPDLNVSETDYFVPQFFQTDNVAFAEALRLVGVPMNLADSMRADPPDPGLQTGAVTDGTYDPPVTYEWSVENTTEGSLRGGVVHVLRGSDDQGSALDYDIECVFDLRWFLNAATVEFEPGSPFEDLVGSDWSVPGNGLALDCAVAIERSDPAVTPEVPLGTITRPWHRGAVHGEPDAAALEFFEFFEFGRPFGTFALTLGEFMEGDARSGEIQIIAPEVDGSDPGLFEPTVLFVRLDANDSWEVIATATDALTVSEPEVDAVVSSPLEVTFRNEIATEEVRVELWPDGATEPIASRRYDFPRSSGVFTIGEVGTVQLNWSDEVFGGATLVVRSIGWSGEPDAALAVDAFRVELG